MKIDIQLSVYLVRNKEGKFFRAKGYGGYGDTWVDDISKCKVYTKIGSARSTITWFANHYPKYGVPDLVELKISEGVVLDESDRVQKAKDKKKREELNHKIWLAEQELERAKSKINSAQSAKQEYEKTKEKLDLLKAQK